jgi:Tol biopolymer transport system component
MARGLIAIGLVLIGFLTQAGAAGAAVGDLIVVANPGNEGHADVASLRSAPSISGDGRLVSYFSNAPGTRSLFLRDLHRGMTSTVFAQPGREAAWATIAAGGRYLAFASGAPVLRRKAGVGGAGGVAEVFVYDRRRGSYTLVSRRSGPDGSPANGNSTVSSISSDGRRVAFGSGATNLALTRPVTIGGVFQRNLEAETTSVVSAEPGIQYWTASSFGPAISGDGRRIAYGFQYSQTPFDPNFSETEIARWVHRRQKQIMLTDPAWEQPRVVTRAAGPHGAIADDNCREPSVSATGRYLAFICDATNLVAGDRNGVEDVFARDVKTGKTTLVSGIRGRIGDAPSNQPSIAGDGRYVSFTTEADNLVAADPDDDPDVLVKDLKTGKLTVASRGLGGAPADGRSAVSAISANGRFVVFYSNASNLFPSGTTRGLAVVRLQLLP